MLDLKEIAERINTQDNRGTENPLFCVFEKERIHGVDPDYHDNVFEDEDEFKNKVWYIEKNRFVNAHFTESAAQEHIRANAHNLTKPFVYVASLYRCREMIAIREFLSQAGRAE